jgi:hypothetical protein
MSNPPNRSTADRTEVCAEAAIGDIVGCRASDGAIALNQGPRPYADATIGGAGIDAAHAMHASVTR